MAQPPNVFITWSKERGKAAATALYEWLHMVIQAAKPWMSERRRNLPIIAGWTGPISGE